MDWLGSYSWITILWALLQVSWIGYSFYVLSLVAALTSDPLSWSCGLNSLSLVSSLGINRQAQKIKTTYDISLDSQIYYLRITRLLLVVNGGFVQVLEAASYVSTYKRFSQWKGNYFVNLKINYGSINKKLTTRKKTYDLRRPGLGGSFLRLDL